MHDTHTNELFFIKSAHIFILHIEYIRLYSIYYIWSYYTAQHNSCSIHSAHNPNQPNTVDDEQWKKQQQQMV